jgi:peptide chain release factor 3
MSQQIARRRTFAIISHPDAGKTTLTEKLLLYGGAVDLAGSVTARKKQRATTSDWMELERKRGISISSTVLQFEYAGYRVNLLDTPGHKDFSEDTYRVLTAVDAAVMVIDAGKGIEPQTRKLFEVCRRRGVPIFTFMNKLDRPAREPLDLLDELERVLGIHSFAVNWPLGNGKDFQGVYDRLKRQVHLFDRTEHGAHRAPVQVKGLEDPSLRDRVPAEVFNPFYDEVQMLDGAGAAFDDAAVLRGELTPVFFGSAMNNFGVQMMLDYFLEHSSPPTPRQAQGRQVAPLDPPFSGFIFKIQANMDPRHRDRLAFVRVVSGKFVRDMTVTHIQTGRKVRLNSAHSLFGRERETVDEAWPGDVVGLVGGRDFGIGDTLTEDPAIVFHEIPRFVPECFAFLHNPNTADFKKFDQGLQQLLQEGVIQAFAMPSRQQRVPLLGAVGPLQFEIVQYRLESEYNVQSRLEPAQWRYIKWLALDPAAMPDLSLPTGVAWALDGERRPVVLFDEEWSIRFFTDRHKDVALLDNPPASAAPTAK